MRIARLPTVFSYDPRDGVGMHVHEDDYPAAAQAFDRSDDPQFVGVKAQMAKFGGPAAVIVD